MVISADAGERRVAAAEANAARIISWEPLLIPGLLQTPAYTTALLERLPAKIRPNNAAIAHTIAIRSDRQQLVFRRQPSISCHFIFHEAALLALANHPDKQQARTQLQRLLNVDDTRVTIQVAASSRGIHLWPGTSFYIVHAADSSALLVRERLDDVDSVFSTDSNLIESLSKEWSLLVLGALSMNESFKLIKDILDSIGCLASNMTG